MNRPRAMVMLTRSVPRTTRPARASISVAPCALRRSGEDVLNCRFIIDQSELSAEAGEEKPLVEVGTDEVESIGRSETGRGTSEGDLAVEGGLAGDVDLIDGKATRKRRAKTFVVAFAAVAAVESGVGEVEDQIDGLIESLGALARGGVEIFNLSDGIRAAGSLEGGTKGEGGGGGDNSKKNDSDERFDESKSGSVFHVGSLLLNLCLNLARQDIRIRAASAFAAVGAVADDLVGGGFAGLEILIGVAPGVGGDGFDEIGYEDF